MSGSETESQKAAGEARRDVLGHVVQPGTGGRYDALLGRRGVLSTPQTQPAAGAGRRHPAADGQSRAR